jgi:hypothetical protein
MNDVAPFVRHLLTLRASKIIELLSTFYNVENLAIWIGSPHISPEILKKMNDLPLRMLSVVMTHMSLDAAVMYCPAFRNVTHLEITWLKISTWVDWKTLVEFPNLTHLCFNFSRPVENEIILGLLVHCPSLRAMIFQPFYARTTTPDDHRFLIFQDGFFAVEEWEKSANGGIGLWELADIIIAARRGEAHSFSTCLCSPSISSGYR